MAYDGIKVLSFWSGRNRAKSSDFDSYDISDLLAKWQKGWSKIRDLPCVSETIDRAYINWRVGSAISEVWGIFHEFVYLSGMARLLGDSAREYSDFANSIIAMVLISKENPYKPFSTLRENNWLRRLLPQEESDKRGAKLRVALKKVTTAFGASQTCGEAITKIAGKARAQEFLDFWSYLLPRWRSKEFSSFRIESHWQKAMQWLTCGLKNESAIEEVFWNCVWLFIEPIVNEMIEIKAAIDASIPPTNEQIRLLNYYTEYGYPNIYIAGDKTKKNCPKLILKPRCEELNEFSLEMLGTAILIQPAFVLSQELKDRRSTAAFVRQCRAPSCGRRFYTQRDNAKTCGGSKGNKKTPCQLQWLRYKRYLKKIGKEPEKDWNDKQLQKDFISYDNS